MPDLTVTGCHDCPFMRIRMETSSMRTVTRWACDFGDGPGDEVVDEAADNKRVADGCPLRSGAVTVRLEGDGNG